MSAMRSSKIKKFGVLALFWRLWRFGVFGIVELDSSSIVGDQTQQGVVSQ
jgi:hypothetical protein